MTEMIGWAIIHSVWQAGVIAALTALLLWAFRRASAATRYLISAAGLLVMVALPIITVRMTVKPTDAAVATQDFTAIAPAADAGPPTGTEEATSSGDVVIPNSTFAPRTVALRATLENWLPWIVVAWLLGVLLMSVRTVTGFVWARRLVRQGTKPVSDHIRGAAARIADNMGVRVSVRVLESTRVTVPILVGWTRPVILMPASLFTGLMPQQIEAILAHELAHVRRNDYLVNLLQTVVETLYFYHPAAWWLSGRIREERENACDELAVAACGGDRVFYSRVLLTVEESRGDAPLLAVAASGGSLSRRIHRLLGAQQAHLDIGPRWYAGVVTIGMAVVTATGIADEKLPLNPRDDFQVTSQDTTKARPSAVLKSEAGSLDERWQWAEAQARSNRYDRYWIGYMLDPSTTRTHEWVYVDRKTPVRMGESIMMGGFRTDGDPKEMRIAGVPLNDILGNQEPQRIVVFMGYEKGQLARVHLASFVFPMHFGEAPLLWLGRANDVESVARVARLDAASRDDDVRKDLTAILGMHADAQAALPVIEKWATDRSRSSDLREEAVEELQNFSSPRVLSILSAIARNDEYADIRAEAVEALGHLTELGTLDTLRHFAHTMDEERLQNEAVEALANLPEKESVPALRALIEDRSLTSELRAEALEALAHRTKAPAVLEMLAQYARSSDDEHVQMEAVEAMGEVDANHEAAIRELKEIIESHERTEVRMEAVETLSNFKESSRDLAEIALSRHPMEVRMEAVEAYMTRADPVDALSFAKRVLDSDAPAEIRHEVIDALESLHGGRGIPLLIEIARTTTDREVRRQALEALIDSDDPRAVAALKKVQ